jgi:aminocarboxymuconate-semialdehyde decarboxylase
VRAIDIHAHITPEGCLEAMRKGAGWHSLSPQQVARRFQSYTPRGMWTPEERLKDMDSLGVDVHILSTHSFLYCYDGEAAAVARMDRECNDYVAQLTKEYPRRFAGLANLPMQDVRAAVTELERSVAQLGLKGAMIGDHVNGKTYDDPEFHPLWEAAEQLGAVMLIHQDGPTLVRPRANRYHLPNTVGNLVDRAVTFASLVFGGVMGKYPDLRVCLCHGGGYTCYGIGRMDRGWQVRSEARSNIQKPPSAYLSRFYYDCLTHSEPALRYLIDTVGIDRVVFGTDWPADMAIDWPVSWILSLESLTQEEKEAILWKNLEKLLDI